MFLKRFAVLFYVTIMIFLSSAILLFALNWLRFEDVYVFLYAAYHDLDLRLLVGILALILLLKNFMFYSVFSVNIHRDKIIAFDNPSGRVSVSLVALEDLIKRMIIKMAQVKDVKVRITASKKGLQVKIRLILASEVNIPEITSKVQDQSKRKIQDTIGLEEPIDVAIYIGKILSERIKGKQEKEKEDEDEPSAPNIPFQGYRA